MDCLFSLPDYMSTYFTKNNYYSCNKNYYGYHEWFTSPRKAPPVHDQPMGLNLLIFLMRKMKERYLQEDLCRKKSR